MSGEIIDFRSLRELRRAKLYRQQPVPRAQTRDARLRGELARLATLDEQIDRIIGLLGELDALTRDAKDLPSTLRLRARASIDLAGGVLEEVCARPEENATDDPQPEVGEILERMYRDLDLHA
jgi:hypothetical protein